MTQETVTRLPVRGRELQRSIVARAQALGWLVATFPPVQTEHGWRTPAGGNGKGWPDCCLVRDRIVFAEVKGDTDRLRPDQKKWLSALKLAGAEAYVWSPADWADGSIEEVLSRRAS